MVSCYCDEVPITDSLCGREVSGMRKKSHWDASTKLYKLFRGELFTKQFAKLDGYTATGFH